MEPHDNQDSRVTRLCAVLVLAWSLAGLQPVDSAPSVLPTAIAKPAR